jgi:hypothetical protein
MKLLLFYSNPHRGGLGDACYDAAKRGAIDGNADITEIQLNDLEISNCMQRSGKRMGDMS